MDCAIFWRDDPGDKKEFIEDFLENIQEADGALIVFRQKDGTILTGRYNMDLQDQMVAAGNIAIDVMDGVIRTNILRYAEAAREAEEAEENGEDI